MSSRIWRILLIVTAFTLVAALGLGAGPIAHLAQQASANLGGGFVLIVALMTVLLLISIARMPLSHASVRRRHR